MLIRVFNNRHFQVLVADNGSPSITSAPVTVLITLVTTRELEFGFESLDGYNVTFMETPTVGGLVVTVFARDSLLQVSFQLVQHSACVSAAWMVALRKHD